MALDCLVMASNDGELEGFLTKPDYKGKSYLLTTIGVSQCRVYSRPDSHHAAPA